MPFWVQPTLRALQEAEESEGLIPARDSVGVTVKKAQETAGTNPKQVPVQQKRILRGNTYTAS